MVFYKNILIITLIYFKIFNLYETPAEYPAINGGDECGAGVRVLSRERLRKEI